MCVVSMVMDHKWDEWNRRYQPPFIQPVFPQPDPMPFVPLLPLPTSDEIEEFRRLLERARDYDKRTGQPDCELEEKKQKIKKLADALGIAIDFI